MSLAERAAEERRRSGAPPVDQSLSDDGVRLSRRCSGRAAALDGGGGDDDARSAAESLATEASSELAEWFDRSIGIDSSAAPRSPPVNGKGKGSQCSICQKSSWAF